MHPALVILATWLLLGPAVLAAWSLVAALRMLVASLYGQLTVYAIRRQQRTAFTPKVTHASRSHVALPSSQRAGQLASQLSGAA